MHDTKVKKRKKKNKRRELDIMRKNMDPKKFKQYLMQKIKLLKKELELNANVLRKNPTKIVAKIRQAELKAKLEETVRYIPKKQSPQQQKLISAVITRRVTPGEVSSYKKFVRRTVKNAPSGYMSKEDLLEKLLEEFDLTKGWLFGQLGITDFAQFLKKESSVYVDFYGYVNSTIKRRKEDDQATKALKEVIVSAKVMKRFNSVFGERTSTVPEISLPPMKSVPSEPPTTVENHKAEKLKISKKIKLLPTICKGISITEDTPAEVRTPTLTPSSEEKVVIELEPDVVVEHETDMAPCMKKDTPL